MFRKVKTAKNLLFKKIKKRKDLKKYKKTAVHKTILDLITDIKALCIKKGDILFVHSSLKKIGYLEGGPRTVINALLEVLGSDGTLVFPTFTRGTMFNICTRKDFIFDPKTTPTGLGSIPSDFLSFEGIIRSIHPTHSVSVIGKYAKQITEHHHIGDKAFGKNSPFGKLVELNGKILGIGLTLKHAPTQYHYIEDIPEFEFPFRVKVEKIYDMKCKLNTKKYITVQVQPLDPEVAKTRIDKDGNTFIQNYLWEIYEKTGVFTLGKIGEAASWLVNAKEFCDMLMKLAKIGITIYSTEEYLKVNDLYPFQKIKDLLSSIKL